MRLTGTPNKTTSCRQGRRCADSLARAPSVMWMHPPRNFSFSGSRISFKLSGGGRPPALTALSRRGHQDWSLSSGFRVPARHHQEPSLMNNFVIHFPLALLGGEQVAFHVFVLQLSESPWNKQMPQKLPYNNVLCYAPCTVLEARLLADDVLSHSSNSLKVLVQRLCNFVTHAC